MAGPVLPHRKGIALSIAAAFWAAMYLIPFQAAAALAARPAVALGMLAVAAVLNTATGMARTRRAPRFDRIAVLASIALAVLTVVGNLALIESLARTEAAVTSVVLQTQVLLVAILGALALGERSSPRLVGGALVAIAGFALMQAPWLGATGHDLHGSAWALLASLCFASMLVVVRKVIARVDPLAVNALRLWMSVGILLCIPGTIGGLSELGGRGWLLAAAAAVCGPTASRLLLMYAVRYIPASNARLLVMVSPVFALGLGFFAFGAWPSGRELAGGAVILAGVALPALELVREGDRAAAAPPADTP